MEYVSIGIILNTRGIKGELKVKSNTDFPEDRFAVGKNVFIKCDKSYKKMTISSYKLMKNVNIITFKGYEDINEVLQFKNCELFADKSDILDLEENEFYAEELIGLDIFQNEEKKGKVIEIKTLPQGDYLVVQKLDDNQALIPFREEFVTEINFDDNRIDIIEMEGLL